MHDDDVMIWENICGSLRGETPGPQKRQEMLSFDVFFVNSRIKLLKSICRWFETQWRPCDVILMSIQIIVLCLLIGVDGHHAINRMLFQF